MSEIDTNDILSLTCQYCISDCSVEFVNNKVPWFRGMEFSFDKQSIRQVQEGFYAGVIYE